MSITADIQERRSRSLRILQTIQKNSDEIVEDATYVALYRFVEDEQKWTRMEIEGSSFITRNRSKPNYSFIILNKIGDRDLVLQIEEDILKVKIQDKYVMMQCLHQEGRVIFGLWFHDSNERLRAFECIQSIIKNKNQTPALRRVDISSILSSSSSTTSTSTNERPHITDQSMANALTKSSQLLALLKKTACEASPQSQPSATENKNSNTDLGTLPSSATDATAKLKSFLFTSPKVASVATTGETKEGKPDDSHVDDRCQLLLALVKGNSVDKNQSSSKASEASSGAELMTDGDISRKLQALIAKPATPSTQQPTVVDSLRTLPTASISSPSTPLTAVSSIQLIKTSPKLSNAMNDLRLSPSSSLFEPSVLMGSESIKTAKKPSITLISPSDLGAF